MEFRKGQNSDIFEFNFDEHVDLAMQLLNVDKNLASMYSKLVPLNVNEESFWKSYFYNVEQVKTQVMTKYSNTSAAESNYQSREAILRELDSDPEDDDDDPIL